jgi:hypothetical protein
MDEAATLFQARQYASCIAVLAANPATSASVHVCVHIACGMAVDFWVLD